MTKEKIHMHPQTEKEIKDFLTQPSHALLLLGNTSSSTGLLAAGIAENLAGSSVQASQFTYNGKESGIDQVREIISSLKLKSLDKNRIIIIENIDHLKHEAQNALLKILEEPPIDTYFIATATEQNSILPTVVSRMTQLRVRPLTLEQAKQSFSGTASSDEITKAFYLADGESGLMKELLYSDQQELKVAIDWAKKIIKLNEYERLLLVDELSKADKNVIREYISAIRKVIRASILHGKNLSPDETRKRVLQLDAIYQAQVSLRANVSPKLLLTDLFLTL